MRNLKSTSTLKSFSLSLFITFCVLTQTACPGKNTLNKVLNILDSVPVLVEGFQLGGPQTQAILKAFADGQAVIRTLRDSPTKENWGKALEIFDTLQSRNAFNISDPKISARLSAIAAAVRVILAALAPSTGADNKVSQDEIDEQVKELERLVKQ
jgi:hypothetical protein